MPFPLVAAAAVGVAGLAGWALRGLSVAKAVGGAVKDAYGQIEDEITVKLVGGPLTTMKQLHRLAAAIAFGKVRRLVPAGNPGSFTPLPGMMGIQYSLERKELVFHLRMTRSVATMKLYSGKDALEGLPVFAGPTDTTTGGNWDFVPTVPGAKPFLPITLPPLKYAGKTILTPDATSTDPVAGGVGPTKHLRPVGDARSRAALVRMVTAALSGESRVGGAATFKPPAPADRFTGG